MSLTAPSPEAIKAFRKKHGFTQASLGDAIGVSGRAIEEWEAGRRTTPVLLTAFFLAFEEGLLARPAFSLERVSHELLHLGHQMHENGEQGWSKRLHEQGREIFTLAKEKGEVPASQTKPRRWDRQGQLIG